MKKILIVEDEKKILEAVKAYLEHNNFQTFTAEDGENAMVLFEKVKPDLVILDLMLPKISGEQVCQNIRKISNVPIIMLTAKSSEDDKVAGFAFGADDYVTKPFSPRELLARVNSLFRRYIENTTPIFSTMSWNNGDLEINFETHTVKKNGQLITLTPNEFKLLSLLIKSPQKTFTREELIEIAFGIDFDGFERTIDTHIKNIRSKIEDNTSSPKYVLTVRGVGYKFGGT